MPDLHDAAVLHDGDAVGEADRLVEIVGDEDDGLLAAPPAGAGTRPASRGGSAGRAPRTARRGTRAPARRRASGRCRPAAAGRRRARAGRSLSRPASPTSSIISRARASRVRAVDALDLEREGDIAEHGEVRQQGEVLEHHAHLVPADLDHLALGRPRAGCSPLNRISPAVGSTSRDRQRTSVDLPEPDRPMMTKISPSRDVERDVAHRGDQRRRRRAAASVGAPPASERPSRRRRTASRPTAGELDGCRHRRVARAHGAAARRRLRPDLAGADDAYSIQVYQRPRCLAIQSATTSSTFLPSRSTAAIIWPISSLLSVKRLDRLVGARPLVLDAGPADLPDRAVRLAAVVGGVGVRCPRPGRCSRPARSSGTRPTRPRTWPAPSAARRSRA